jgi:DNA-binding Xre family transcriptional regulator
MLSVIKIKIRELLEKKGVTRYRAAKDSGVPYNTLLKLENNKMKTIDFSNLEKLCDYFDCSPNDLLAVEK